MRVKQLRQFLESVDYLMQTLALLEKNGNPRKEVHLASSWVYIMSFCPSPDLGASMAI